MTKNKKLELGDEVLIFRYIPSWGINQDYKNYLIGKVVSYELSDDISYHGSAQYVTNYTVIDNDGKIHYGNYYYPYLGNSFFMTREDYVNLLEGLISSNNETIDDIKKENDELDNIIKKINGHVVVRSKKKNGGK